MGHAFTRLWLIISRWPDCLSSVVAGVPSERVADEKIQYPCTIELLRRSGSAI